ncbi:MAG: hypothetical protein A2551_06950 [Elusimicrobia bacterium RIFOXYD2_FULL_34_30]|nr:MAG: hypothetical protein A2551_06950 [Elusimicrobia bacterium RIFOXYD2_FULL_34_30]
MKELNNNFEKGNVVIYKNKSKQVQLEVKLEKETVWLTQKQIAVLFGTQRPAITKHLNNVFKRKELEENSVCSILEHTATDGKVYHTKFYNLDVIISVGYRVNSKLATQFRIWATKVLKGYLVKGYTINQKMLLRQSEKLRELQNAISFLQEKSQRKLLEGQSQEILNLLGTYSKSFSILEQYDKNKLETPQGKKPKFILSYEDCLQIISKIKQDFSEKKEASSLFGQESGRKFESIARNLYQTFGGKELYKSIEEKASHLLYLTIKDHPFIDGNKRIASFFFVYFLDRNNFLYKMTGERKINDNTLVALSLLIAESNSKEKDTMIKIIINILSEKL